MTPPDDDVADAPNDAFDDETPQLPACPFCGFETLDCGHVFGTDLDGDEHLPLVPEWGAIDDVLEEIERLTFDGPSTLDALARKPGSWWLEPSMSGFGRSRRLAGLEAVARKLSLESGEIDEGAVVVYYAKDVAAARAKLQAALLRITRDLKTLARRLGHEPD